MKILSILLLLISGAVMAQSVPDYAKETRWAAQVEDGLMDGDVVWINNADRKFLGIYTESESESNKVAVVMHGIGVHPNWSGVIQPLRLSLINEGYNTLAIQLPVLANGIEGSEYRGLFNDSDKRINATVAYLQSQGKVVDLLVAHSLGTSMATHYLSGNSKHPFKRFVAVGMNGGSTAYLKKVNIPVLDVYGTEDIKPVLTTVNDRKNASKHNTNYTQTQIEGDHFFTNNDELLSKTVANWLK